MQDMDRRALLALGLTSLAGLATGCRGKQYAHVLSSKDEDMVGSHQAGAETWEPLVADSMAQLLGRQHVEEIQQTSATGEPCRKRICFVGVENRSAEDLGDFRDQIYEKIDTSVTESSEFDVINRRYVEAGLRQCGLRADDLFMPQKRRAFQAAMEQQEQQFDYLLFATITSGTTRSNSKDYQRDYLFTLELVDVNTGRADKESTELRKGYHKTKLGAIRKYGHT